MPLWHNLALVAGALAIDGVFGYPDALFRAVRHPVVWIGALLDRLEGALNRPAWPPPARRAGGLLALVLLLAAIVLPAAALQAALPGAWVLLLALPAAALPAQRSLYRHVRAVADALERDGLGAGRAAVSRIVGRDPERLDEAGVVRAAIESLAENFSDGVVAPLFWLAVAGLPGALIYKAVNTADSMIGHLSARHRAFGWAAARLDDLVNLPASRLSALWLALAAGVIPGASARGAWRAVWRDAGKHRSPNAGWPEAAMAGSLGLRLAGPRVYHGEIVDDAWMGEGRAEADAGDIRRALRLYRMACALQALVVAVLAFVIK